MDSQNEDGVRLPESAPHGAGQKVPSVVLSKEWREMIVKRKIMTAQKYKLVKAREL